MLPIEGFVYTPKASTYHALYICMPNSANMMKAPEGYDKVVEVTVDIDGVKKEFTLHKFKRLLGME